MKAFFSRKQSQKRISRSSLFRKQQLKQVTDSAEKSDPAKRKSRQFILALVLVSLSLGIAIYTLFFSSLFRIKEVVVTNSSTITSLDQHMVEQTFQYLVGKNILLYTPTSIRNVGFSSIPRLKDLHVDVLYPETIRIDVTEKSIVLALPSKNNFALVNEDGVIVKTAATIDSPLFPVFVAQDDKSNLDTFYLNQQLFTPEQVVYFIVGKALLEQKIGFTISQATWYPMAKEIHFQTDKGLSIWFDTELTVDTQLEKLITIYGQIQKDLAKMKYIDLRIPEKAMTCLIGKPCSLAQGR